MRIPSVVASLTLSSALLLCAEPLLAQPIPPAVAAALADLKDGLQAEYNARIDALETDLAAEAEARRNAVAMLAWSGDTSGRPRFRRHLFGCRTLELACFSPG